MTKDKSEKRWNEILGISIEEFENIVKAVSQVYPMIVIANLTPNTYLMLKNEEFLCNDVMTTGYYEDLIDDNLENIHTNYQQLFQECFSREHLLESFKAGKNEVYAEVYQKNKKGNYQWVSTHVIRIKNGSDDVCHICLNRVLDGIVEERHISRN